ncbi:MAG TPA: ROK family protein, partial [Eubacteriales bacterium]|nr:ROK family protein [Eubacteriales bacterium]
FPEIIIMGGGISNEGDYIVKPIQRYLNKHIYGKGYNPKIKVTAASLKNDAGIVGAAALTMHDA